MTTFLPVIVKGGLLAEAGPSDNIKVSTLQVSGAASVEGILSVQGITGVQLPPDTSHLAMATDASTDLSALVVIGGSSFDATGYTVAQFVTTASVTGSGLTGEVQLWNLTNNLEVARHTYSGVTTPTEQTTTVVLANSSKVYEIRHRVTGGSATSDRVNTTWAGLRLTTNV